MLYAGIDVAKNKHDICVLDHNGKIIIRHLQIKNNHEGFLKLQMTFANLMNAYEDSLDVALEDTGHYAYNIVRFLRANGYPTFSYNPLLIKDFAQAQSLRKTKTDKKDAQTIAQKLRMDANRVAFEVDPIMIELKYATRNVADWKEKCTKQKVSYTRLLDLLFPELASVIGKAKTAKHNKYVYELLKKYPSPHKIAKARITTLTKIISKASCGKIGEEKARHIQEAAKKSIGQLSPSLEFQLLQTIHSIEFFAQLRVEAEVEVNKLMKEIDSPLLSVPGIGSTLAAVILSETRNIQNFSSPAQLLAYAGAEPSVSTSGENQTDKGHMVKRGSSRLRWAIMESAKQCARWSPKMREYFMKKLAEGKHYNVAISHVAKKLVRIIFHILKYNNVWDETKIIVN